MADWEFDRETASLQNLDGSAVGSDGGSRRQAPASQRISVLDTAGDFPARFRALLERRFELAMISRFPTTAGAVKLLTSAPLLIKLNRKAVSPALKLCRTLRMAGGRQPIVLFADFESRSADRTHALALGADDYLSGNVSADELLMRFEILLSRGRGPERPAHYFIAPPRTADISQPPSNGREPPLMSASSFLDSIRTHLDADELPIFSVVLFRTKALPRLLERQFERVLVHQVRRSERDLIGSHKEGVIVYLHGVVPVDARRFVGRVLARWSGLGGKSVEFLAFGYPGQREAVLEFVADSKRRRRGHRVNRDSGNGRETGS